MELLFGGVWEKSLRAMYCDHVIWGGGGGDSEVGGGGDGGLPELFPRQDFVHLCRRE